MNEISVLMFQGTSSVSHLPKMDYFGARNRPIDTRLLRTVRGQVNVSEVF